MRHGVHGELGDSSPRWIEGAHDGGYRHSKMEKEDGLRVGVWHGRGVVRGHKPPEAICRKETVRVAQGDQR
jgi:hypothetical protein